MSSDSKSNSSKRMELPKTMEELDLFIKENNISEPENLSGIYYKIKDNENRDCRGPRSI